MKIRHLHGKKAFSLIELLVVVAIISLLTGLLTPGISALNRAAKKLKQKSVFHGYETGLELFHSDFDDYPDSHVLPTNGTNNLVCGAQHLAEAMMGIDQKGFDPKSKWYAPAHGTDVYASAARGSSAAEIAASDNRRKEIYIEQKDDGCYAIADLYDGNTGQLYSPSGFNQARAPVLTDIFRRKRVELTTETGQLRRVKVGSPVLYFKADTATDRFKGTPPLGNYRKYIYNYEDNRAIIELGTVRDPTVKHRYDQNVTETVNGQSLNGVEFFYHKIMNPDVDAYEKPYNPKTFILMSAGWDGVFGTKDDVTNFNY